MSTVFFMAGLVVVVVGFVFAALVVLSSLFEHGKRLFQMLGGVPTETRCPWTKQPTNVWLGSTVNPVQPSVLYCERFGSGQLHCNAECFSKLSNLSERLAA